MFHVKQGSTEAKSSIDSDPTALPAALTTLTGLQVVNGAAATFGVTLPTQITAGTPFTSKVTVSDAYGNGVKNYFGTVHFSTSAALAGLPADYTFSSADAGVHTFTLTLNTGGSQTLSVADTANPDLGGSASGIMRPGCVPLGDDPLRPGARAPPPRCCRRCSPGSRLRTTRRPGMGHLRRGRSLP